MSHVALVSLITPDRSGLVSAVTGCLYDLGVAIGDATFAVLGEGAEFSAILEVPDGLGLADLEAALAAMPMLAEARAAGMATLTVSRFPLHTRQMPMARVTHRLALEGPDQPGIIARVTEILTEYEANIVRLNSERVGGTGPAEVYDLSIACWIDPARADTCLAALANTAQQLHLRFSWQHPDP